MPTGSIPTALSKKDDDLPRSRGHTPARSASWPHGAPRMRKRRFAGFVLAVVILYFFIKYMPTNLTPVAHRPNPTSPGRTYAGIPIPKFGSPGKSRDKGKKGKVPARGNEAPPNADLSFAHLATSLQEIARTRGYGSSNRNVLFAAANTESAARLVPLACEMARWDRNTVHFVYMARDSIPFVELQELNGPKGGCGMYWHGVNVR